MRLSISVPCWKALETSGSPMPRTRVVVSRVRLALGAKNPELASMAVSNK